MLSHDKFPHNKYPDVPLLGAIPSSWLLKIQQNGFAVLVTCENSKKTKNNDANDRHVIQ